MIDLSIIVKSVYPDISADGMLYLDPGSGSFLLQILIATIAGAGIFIAASWRKVKAFFIRIFKKGQTPTKTKKT
ncbi:MAG: hypothetical protein JW704_10070 [Anaerolineaceae bacterium]|nr:hypothetical protein [Anaerolineaceae bacterium]MBN2677092.1 hypothetical protein [Anaerolineaceae bacterium]